MKKYIYSFVVLLLLTGMISCNKEEITIEDPEIIIDPPVEIEYPIATGIVKDENGGLAEAQVSVYQQGELKGTTLSNLDGEFSTIDIETVSGEDLVIEFSKEEYNSSYRKRSEEALKASSLDVELTNSDGQMNTPVLIEGISEYISFSGYIKDSQGQPSAANIAVVLQAPLILDGQETNVYISYQEITDSDGYYELLFPKQAFDLNVAIYSQQYCLEVFTEQEVVIPPAPAGVLAEQMGPFTEDVVLPDYINPRSSVPSLEVAGQVTNCDGSTPIWPGAQIYVIDSEDFTIITEMEIDDNGNFSYSIDECLDLPYTVKIVGYDIISNRNSDTTEVFVTDGVYSNLNMQLPACNVSVESSSTAVMNVGGMEYTFDQINPRMENGNLISDELNGSYGVFTIPNIQFGNNEIHNLDLGDWGQGVVFKAINAVMTADVTALTTTEATVIVTGDFTDVNGVTVNGTCTLNLNF